VDGVSRRFVDALWPAKPDFHAALPSQVAIFERAEPTDKQHQIPLIKGSKNVEFHALRAIFRVASANFTNKGHRDSQSGRATAFKSDPTPDQPSRVSSHTGQFAFSNLQPTRVEVLLCLDEWLPYILQASLGCWRVVQNRDVQEARP
jgi:hypothetical protein